MVTEARKTGGVAQQRLSQNGYGSTLTLQSRRTTDTPSMPTLQSAVLPLGSPLGFCL